MMMLNLRFVLTLMFTDLATISQVILREEIIAISSPSRIPEHVISPALALAYPVSRRVWIVTPIQTVLRPLSRLEAWKLVLIWPSAVESQFRLAPGATTRVASATMQAKSSGRTVI